jgi:thermitase
MLVSGMSARMLARRQNLPEGEKMVLKRQTFVFLATLIPALVLLAFSSSVRSQTPEVLLDEDSKGAPYAAGELIVSYEEGAETTSSGGTLDAVSGVLSSVEGADGASVETDIPILDAKVIEFPEVKDDASRDARESSLEEIKEELEGSPGVEGVYYNYVRTGSAAANDPLFDRQYGLKKAGFPAAWKRHPRGVRVAVVDSGVAVEHPDLSRKVVARYDFHNDNETVEDLNGHGTHIAGIVAARTNNRVGVASGCPKCTIIAAKALDQNLSGLDSNIAQAINWSVNRKAKVVNLSLGGLGEKSILKEAIDYANRKGAVVTAAGGNYGDGRTVYPAAYGNVMAVAYTDASDVRSPNSSYGSWMNVAAPGVNIVSTVPGGDYGTRSGSSFSTPHASALAGILFGQGRSKENVFKRIQTTATDVGPRGKDVYYGHGRINAAAASRR